MGRRLRFGAVAAVIWIAVSLEAQTPPGAGGRAGTRVEPAPRLSAAAAAG
jgi:hypothetical protein